MIFSFIFFCLSFLNPVHTLPWAGFFSEISAFIAVLLLFPLLFKNDIQVPRITLPFLFVSVIPLIQLFLGNIFYISNAVLSTIYLFYFWLMIVLGFNFSINRENINNNLNILYFLIYLFLVVGLISSFFSIFQWLNIYNNFIFIMDFKGNRPYANMAQPNHLATFLSVSVLACWYLFEKNKLNSIFCISLCLLFIFSIALTQSRTVWLISIFVISVIFLKNKNFKYNLNKKIFLLWLFYFILCVLVLPTLNVFLANYFDIIQTSTILERTTTGYTRFNIWNQMVQALIEKPWSGYGWNQTTAAQFSVIDQHPGNEWATSGHNLFLDIIIWCGLPLGIFIIVFIFYFYMRLIKNINSISDLFSFLAISIIGIHSLFEYPLYYSYFLLIFGLFCGVLLKYEKKSCVKVHPIFLIGVFCFSIFFIIEIFQEYMHVDDNLFAGRLHAMGDLRTDVDLPYKLYILDNFEYQALWLGLYPKKNVNEKQIIDAKNIVQTSLKPYNIHKYAQLLAWNGDDKEAIRQLKILHVMCDLNFTYKSLLEEEDGKNIIKVKKYLNRVD